MKNIIITKEVGAVISLAIGLVSIYAVPIVLLTLWERYDDYYIDHITLALIALPLISINSLGLWLGKKGIESQKKEFAAVGMGINRICIAAAIILVVFFVSSGK